ncbi:cytochrome c [Hyphococcus flavus]|uniref:Cytochrome c n=1 Tax=Hyphococcus flavus TaxID=1866326 RepID=A0AAF0CB87_9PROT|nr:cytochrome c [Hyphococcus flavus]WDI30250.1 cytochrome c [Hyphococcus flavus]
MSSTSSAILKSLGAGAALVLIASCGGSGDSASNEQTGGPVDAAAQEIADTRHEAMEDIGGAFKTIRDQMNAGSPDMDAVRTAAAFIEEQSTQVGDWFPPETSPVLGVDTEALATIWEQPEEFASAVERFETAAAALNTAAQSGDADSLASAVQGIGGACKNCHDSFRVDD